MKNKKSFKNLTKLREGRNPAEQFITIPNRGEDATPQAHEASSQAIPSGNDGNQGDMLPYLSPKPETKSKRIQLLIRPSLYNRARAAADHAGISFNEVIHVALEKLLASINRQ